MKRFFISLVVVLAVLSFGCNAEATNLLTNPGFETGTMTPWAKYQYPAGAGSTPTPTAALTGSYGLWIYTASSSPSAPSVSIAYQDVNSTQGDSATASAYLRTPNGQGWYPGSFACVRVLFLNSSYSVLATYESAHLTTANTPYGNPYTVTTPAAPAGTAKARIELYLEKPISTTTVSVANFDDASLELQQVSLLSNPGFDQEAGNGIPASWSQWAGSSVYPNPRSGGGSILTESLKRNGEKALCVYLYGPDDAWAGVSQDVSVSPGTVYAFAGWLRLRYAPADSPGDDTEAYLEIKWYDNNNPANCLGTAQSEKLTTADMNNKWHYLVAKNIAPPYAAKATVSVVEHVSTDAENAGDLYVDDSSFVIVQSPTEIYIDDFGSYSQYAGGKNDLNNYTGAGGLGTGGYHTQISSTEVLEIHWTATSAWWSSVLSPSSPYKDISSYNDLSFDAKGASGGEKFSISMKDGYGREAVIPLTNYRYNGLSTSWDTIWIPLYAFKNVNPYLDLYHIKEIALKTFINSSGTIQVDNVFVRKNVTATTISNVSVTNITDRSATINFTTSTAKIGRVEYRGSAADSIFEASPPAQGYTRGIIYDPNDSEYDNVFVSDLPEMAQNFNVVNIYGQENCGNGIFDAINTSGLKLVYRVEKYNTETSPATLPVDNFDDAGRYSSNLNDLNEWTGANGLGTGGTHAVTDGVLKVHWTQLNGWWGTNLLENSQPRNLSAYYGISFRIKGEAGGEYINMVLKDGNNETATLPIEAFIFSGGLPTAYSTITIPFWEFKDENPALDLTAIESFSFSFSDQRSSSGTMYVDDINVLGQMVFAYTHTDADWVFNHYQSSIQYVTQNYPSQILYYEINMPMDNERLTLPTLAEQADYVSYLAGRIKNELDNTKPIYVNFYYGYMDELLQMPTKNIPNVDGITLVVYPMHFDGTIYGDGKTDGPGSYEPVHTDTDWLLLMKDQLDYYIGKSFGEDDNRSIYIDQIGYACDYYRPWRYDVNGRVVDNRAKYASTVATRNYIESQYPQIKGWFYFAYYNNNWEANWGMVQSGYEQDTTATTNHSIVLTTAKAINPSKCNTSKADNLLPDTAYAYRIVLDDAEYSNSFSTSALSGRETSPLPTITVTNPPYGNAVVTDDRKFKITWTDSNSRSDATIHLYWDTDDRDGSTNNLITSVSEADTANSYLWDTSSMPVGSYYIYAVLENGGTNKEVWDYSNGQVVICNDTSGFAATPIYAARAEGTITIDGNPSESDWGKAPGYYFYINTHPVANNSSTVYAKAIWDNEAIYFLFKVNDTKVETSLSTTPENDDSVHLAISNGGTARPDYGPPDMTNVSFIGVSGQKSGIAESAFSLMPNTTLDNNSDTDQGYYVEMKVRWVDLKRITPSWADIIPVDILSVDHDNNPGAAWDAPGTIFSKITWDKDSSSATTGRYVKLVGPAGAVLVDDYHSWAQYNSGLNDLNRYTGGNLGTWSYTVVKNQAELEMHWEIPANAWWVSTLANSIPYLNVTPYSKMVMEARGINGGEQFSIALEDSSIRQGIIPITNYLPNGLVSSNYETIAIPLSAFTNANPNLALTSLYNIVLKNFVGSGGRTIRIDNLRFE